MRMDRPVRICRSQRWVRMTPEARTRREVKGEIVVVVLGPLRNVWMVARRLAVAGMIATRIVSQAIMLKDISTCSQKLVLQKCASVCDEGIYTPTPATSGSAAKEALQTGPSTDDIVDTVGTYNAVKDGIEGLYIEGPVWTSTKSPTCELNLPN